MKYLAVLVFVAFFAGLSSAEKDRFDNYKVFAIEVDNEEQLQVLQEIEKVAFSSYDFWKRPTRVGQAVDLMVPPHKMSEFEEIMADLSFRTTLKIPNVQVLIDNEQPKNPRSGFNWDRYWTMDEINAWLDQLVIDYSDVLTPISYGYSYELEQIKGVLLSYRPGNPAVFIESHIHAREWIAGATATWLLNEFLTSTDPEIRYIAENYDWYIFPVTNPDGYRHSHDTNRMWRKTRSRHGVLCRGADPNRNFAYQWQDGNGPGASTNPCSEIFAGPAPFSELETGQLANFVLQRTDHIKVYLSFHSFTQLLLYPFSFTPNPSPIANDLHQIGQAAADRLRQPFGTEYSVFNGHSLYIATGTSVDWSYGGAGIDLSFIYEFRDDGTHGFLLPPDQIIPNSIEVMQSLIGLIGESERLGHLP
ncbi:zinc carboxypeptidase-like [Lutzomyia longipalpis]|uniref:zinc carboxypeptidase-like n=1 Tax=Lutzomyia longipalpis TaxID=7200 RepID=UPI002483E1E2|nr:zinc carboxypeptidase-like [Lutzomyia longipalpis]